MNRIDTTQLLEQLRSMRLAAQGGEQPAEATNGRVNFADLLKDSIDSVSETQKQAGKLAHAFEMGDPKVDLAQVMVAKQKASISFQALMQVRNKLVNAYQDIKNMPV